MPLSSVSVSEAARFLNVSEEEAKGLADAGGNVPLETVRSLAGAAAIARDLASAREEVSVATSPVCHEPVAWQGFVAHPAAVGRQVCWGLRQSMPSSR